MDVNKLIAYIEYHGFYAIHITNGYIGVIDNNHSKSIVKGYDEVRIWLGY